MALCLPHRVATLALLLPLAIVPRRLQAQDNYEIQVYGAETVPRGKTMVEIHSNYTFDGLPGGGGVAGSNHALHETLEITHGFTPWFEIGLYQFTDLQSGYGYDWVGTHVRPRFRVPDEWHWPVGVSLSQEIGYARKQYTPDTWSWEIRPIIDQTVGKLYWSFNPSLEIALAGPNSGSGPEFAPNAKISYAVIPQIAIGLEYYGSLGSVTGFDPRDQQVHDLFPAVDLDLAPEWEVNFGVGFGLTPATDNVIAKLILGRRLPN
jgi:Putative MetA-pathway of phenol degradation